MVAFANAYRDYAKACPGRYAAMQIELDPETAAGPAARRHSAFARAVLRDYRLGEPAETDAVRLLGSAFHGYVSLEKSGGFHHHPRGADVSWDRILNVLDAALRSWPS
ncbi:TetR-like C-terminal domain-containing protein [Fodinicola feengrottensis]|uniref:TetR-like C-terminal domain-containing protein n=1 Tax=Fodinicola feengrottensis TaxID=435914 RepID=UPI00244104E2|nr:TetR-like C-terminal domain-containing protein [Fodinicola feengrottensis]